jgi:hypothetical protein
MLQGGKTESLSGHGCRRQSRKRTANRRGRREDGVRDLREKSIIGTRSRGECVKSTGHIMGSRCKKLTESC